MNCWEARAPRPPRSVFGNYQTASPADRGRATINSSTVGLQPDRDLGIARLVLYRFLAAVFSEPTLEAHSWFCGKQVQADIETAIGHLAEKADEPILAEIARACLRRLAATEFDVWRNHYAAAFGHAARGPCPLNEMEYGDLHADPLYGPHRLADLAAFYRAFNLRVAEDAAERHDHLAIELEFFAVLAAREAYAVEHELDQEAIQVCLEAQRKFLRDHLGRWTPAFARRLERGSGSELLASVAVLLRGVIEADCRRLHVRPGSEDLLLRPVDQSADSACTSCGLRSLPLGAWQPPGR